MLVQKAAEVDAHPVVAPAAPMVEDRIIHIVRVRLRAAQILVEARERIQVVALRVHRHPWLVHKAVAVIKACAPSALPQMRHVLRVENIRIYLLSVQRWRTAIRHGGRLHLIVGSQRLDQYVLERRLKAITEQLHGLHVRALRRRIILLRRFPRQNLVDFVECRH